MGTKLCLRLLTLFLFSPFSFLELSTFESLIDLVGKINKFLLVGLFSTSFIDLKLLLLCFCFIEKSVWRFFNFLLKLSSSTISWLLSESSFIRILISSNFICKSLCIFFKFFLGSFFLIKSNWNEDLLCIKLLISPLNLFVKIIDLKLFLWIRLVFFLLLLLDILKGLWSDIKVFFVCPSLLK